MSSLGSKLAMLAMLALRPRSPAGSAGFQPQAATVNVAATTPIHMLARTIGCSLRAAPIRRRVPAGSRPRAHDTLIALCAVQ
jgi:hypothetical protein